MAEKATTPLEKVIQTAIDSAIKEIHTCLPAVVTKVNYSEQLIDAQITIQRKMAGELVNLPLLVNVPVRYWRSKTFSITFPIEVNDHVLIIFSERSIDTWLTEGGIQNPFDVRKFSLSDAFAIPMMYHQKEVIPDFNTTNLELKTNTGNTKIVIKAAEGIDIHGNINMVSGIITGANVFNGPDSNAHKHAQGNDSDNDTEQDTGVPIS